MRRKSTSAERRQQVRACAGFWHSTGKDHYHADQQAVRQVLKAAPEVRDSARANRAFMQRVVRFLVGEARIRQIIDIGTGIPADGNVHRVAEEIAPDTRVVYVDSSSASFTRSPRHSKDDQAEYPAHQHVGDLEQHPASQAPPRPACRPERGFNYPNRVFERHTYTLVNLLPFAALGWLCPGVIATAILRARGPPASQPWAEYSCQEKVNRQGLSGEIPVIGVLLFAVFLTGTRHRSGQPRRLQVRSSSDISVRSTLLTSSAPTRKTSVSSSWKTRKGPSR